MKRDADELSEIVSEAKRTEAVTRIVRDPLADAHADAEGTKTRGPRLTADSIRLPEGARLTTAAALGQSSPSPRTPEREYSHSPLLYHVAVYPWPQRYNFYQRFVSDAQRYYAVHGAPCAPVPYFSYMPQYAQLGHDQLAWYLWLREQLRSGTYPEDVDFPYILLYIYEIINLPDKLAPQEGAAQLAGVWLAYRARYRELDKYLSEWMCDYCLTYQIPMPPALRPLLDTAIRASSLKEFYIASLSEEEETLLPPSALIAAASDYSYRASRYYAENAAVYDEWIPAAVSAAVGGMGLDPARDLMRQAHTERDAFCGSLCAQTVKRRIVIDYYSFARSYGMRAEVTAAVKLAENAVRRILRIKSRLAVPDAPEAVRAAVGAYFASRGTPSRAASAEEEAYERFYDAPEEGLDLSRSRAIEEESWTNTELLAPQDDEDAPPPADTPSTDTSPADAPPETEEDAASDEALALLETLLSGGTPPITDVTAAAVNEYAADRLGDVVLEYDGRSWRLLDDYREEVASWITEHRN